MYKGILAQGQKSLWMYDVLFGGALFVVVNFF
jgi:hypothetical protein